MDYIERLNRWWQSHCDGEWEHEFGLRIETMDNPGWLVRIDVMYTELAGRPIKPVSVKRSDMDWYECRLADGSACGSSEDGFVHFAGMGGPPNLCEIIEHFLGQVERAMPA